MTIQTEIVNSPDDGGYWVNQFDTETEKSRASEAIYPTEEAAFISWRNNAVEWEEWS